MSSFDDALADPGLSFELAALRVARELEPSVDIAKAVALLDALAEPLRARASALAVEARSEPADRHAVGIAEAELLAAYLGDELGFRGNADDYYAPENSLLDRVLTRRTGIPITLAVVYIAVGTRLGMEVEGIGFPGHFLIRVGGRDGVYQDPYHGGRLLDSARLAELATRYVGEGASVSPAHLAPVDARSLALRMLTNLEAAYARRNEHALAWIAADRLLGVSRRAGYGGTEAHLRNRGLHALAMGSHALAVDDLRAFLDAYPGSPDKARIEALIERARNASDRGSLN